MKGTVIWLTGLPCSGKTTIANLLKAKLKNAVVLDGDVVRKTISSDVGFSPEDRQIHLHRVAHIAKFLAENGIDVICAFVSPDRKVREEVKIIIGSRFIEVWVYAPNWVCAMRDVKGMWKKASEGEIKNFSGWDAPYDVPYDAEVICVTPLETPEESVQNILKKLNENKARAFYIGRWQPFHDGHRSIIRQSLDKDIPVLIGVRDMLPDKSNPFSAEEVKYKLEQEYKNEDVEVIIIPDIRTVNKGRNTGWGVVDHDVTPEIESISGTHLRETKHLNKGEWDKKE